MKQVKPIFGQDYAPGFVLFTKHDNSFLSKGISWFETLRESCEFAASHVLLVVDEKYGIESAERGVEYCELSKYFDDAGMTVICREPEGMDTLAVKQALAYGAKLEKEEVPYDYTGLVLGYPVSIFLNLTSWIKPLRKLPVPFHIPKSRVCSGFVSDCEKNTDRYKDIQLFREYHISRIDPVKFWNYFPFKPLRFDKER